MAKRRTPKLGEQLGTLGEFIAGQRRAAELSLRQLAEQTGISNPYLSQIERGLRRPSAEVLQQLSKALRVSAETLYVRAGILDPEDHPATTVETAVLSDVAITERQKRVLIDVYQSFVRENARDNAPTAQTEAPKADEAKIDTEIDEAEIDDTETGEARTESTKADSTKTADTKTDNTKTDDTNPGK